MREKWKRLNIWGRIVVGAGLNLVGLSWLVIRLVFGVIWAFFAFWAGFIWECVEFWEFELGQQIRMKKKRDMEKKR